MSGSNLKAWELLLCVFECVRTAHLNVAAVEGGGRRDQKGTWLQTKISKVSVARKLRRISEGEHSVAVVVVLVLFVMYI
jgi:hypothetical protein